jgi:GDP-mannose 6-dehydrogenase
LRVARNAGNLRVYDPHIQLSHIYGSNQRFLLTAIPHIGRLMTSDLNALLERAEAVMPMQKPSAEAGESIRASGLPVLDVAGGKLGSKAPDPATTL